MSCALAIPRSSYLSQLNSLQAALSSVASLSTSISEVSFGSLSSNLLVNIKAILTMLSEGGGHQTPLCGYLSCNIPSPESHHCIADSLKQCHCLSNGQNVIIFLPPTTNLRCDTDDDALHTMESAAVGETVRIVHVYDCVWHSPLTPLMNYGPVQKSFRFRSKKCLLSFYKVPSLLL